MLRSTIVSIGILALACARPGKDEDPSTDADTDTDADADTDTDADTDADTDTEYEGDDPGECTDGADNDRDGDFDCDDADCAASSDCDPPAPLQITGTVDGEVRNTDVTLLSGCEGPLALEWDSVAGTVTGTAVCNETDTDFRSSGDINGTISGSSLDGTWAVSLWDDVDVPVTGQLSGTRFTGSFSFEADWGYFEGTFEGYAQ